MRLKIYYFNYWVVKVRLYCGDNTEDVLKALEELDDRLSIFL